MAPETKLASAALLLPLTLAAAPPRATPEHDVTTYPVVLKLPGMESAVVKKGVVYKTAADGARKLDVYRPGGASGALPAIVFVNGVGDTPASRLKEWTPYTSWGRLAAAAGFAAVTFETRGADTTPDIADLFQWLRAHGREVGVDPERLGAWSCSGNVTRALPYLMSKGSVPVRAAAVLYGTATLTNVRTDLPVLLIRSGRDARSLNEGIAAMTARALSENAPWTIVNARGLPHAFDVLVDEEESRRLVRSVLDFFGAHLHAVPEKPAPVSPARAALVEFFARDDAGTAAAYAHLVAETPDDGVAWMRLGRAQLALGKNAEGAASLETAARLGAADANGWYNLSCARALTGKREPALDALEKAVEAGWTDAAKAEGDPDLASLKASPRFASLLQRMRSKAAR